MPILGGKVNGTGISCMKVVSEGMCVCVCVYVCVSGVTLSPVRFQPLPTRIPTNHIPHSSTHDNVHRTGTALLLPLLLLLLLLRLLLLLLLLPMPMPMKDEGLRGEVSSWVWVCCCCFCCFCCFFFWIIQVSCATTRNKVVERKYQV